MKKILLLFMGILLIGLVSAETSIGISKQGENVELYQACNNCTYCNFTSIKYPNGSTIISIVETTQDETYYYHNLDGSNTSDSGIYTYCYDCGNAVEKAVGCLEFEITPTGQEITESQGLTSIGLIISIIAVAFLFMIVGYKFADTKWFPISLLFLALSLLLAVYSLHLGYIYTESILFPLAVQGGQSAIFMGILWAMVALILIGMLFFTIKVIKTALDQKAIRDYGEGFDTKTGMYE